jgi:hypothetical protein
MKAYTSSRLTNAQRTFWSMNELVVPAHSVWMSAEADASAMDRLRSEAKHAGDTVPSFTAFAVKAAALTMKKHPQANQAILGLPFFRRLCRFNNADISVAVEKDLPSLPGQAMAAVVKNTSARSLGEITRELQRLRNCTAENDAVLRQFETILRYVPWPLSSCLLKMPHYFPGLWVRHYGCACWVNAPASLEWT